MADETLTVESAPVTESEGRMGERRWRRRFALLRVPVAAGGGVLIALAFPPVGAWPLAPLGVATVTLAIHGAPARRGALLGFIAGLGFFLPLLYWLGAIFFRLDSNAVGAITWIGVSVLQAAFWLPLGAGAAVVARLPLWPAWTAALWVAMEAARGRIPFGGFTWGRLAFSQGDTAFTPYASLGGAPFVTFLVALSGALTAWALLCLWRRRLAASAVTVAAAVAVPALGLLVPLSTGAQGGREVTVAAVQGNVPDVGLRSLGPQRAVLNNHVAATRALADKVRAGTAPRPDFVVWPETAADLDPFAYPRVRSLIQSTLRDLGAPGLIGTTTDDYTRNVSVAWSPESGPGERYLKRRLVPFAEYIPFRQLLAPRVDLINELRPNDLVAGTKPGTVTIGGIPVAVTICFDIAYDNVVREAVNGGGKILVVQTNNATFGDTAQPEQQLAIERLRAVEHSRAVVVAATSGISTIIAPDGRLIEASKPFTRDVLVADIALRGQRTLADRLGATPEWILAAAGVLAAGVAITRSAINRRR